MKKLLLLVLIAQSICTSCQLVQERLVKEEDYAKYLLNTENSKLLNLDEQIAFWSEKETKNPNNVFKYELANLYTRRFQIGGDIRDLKYAEELLEELDQRMIQNKAGLYRSLAANAISQHQFEKAYIYATQASQIKDKQYASKLVLFDACMELAHYDQAEAILKELEDKNSFAYQIRYAKWLDYQGDLDQAVNIMEDCLSKISSGDEDLMLWTLSNLGDMYGHQGQIEKAYQAYLNALAIDSNYHYALKGIAHIAFAHDRDTEAAKRILNYLIEVHPIPDYKLMLAQIADFEQLDAESLAHKTAFMEWASQADYGHMYNKYLCEIYLEADQYDQAIAIAQEEIIHRATPESYDLLAWSYYQQGQHARALEIALQHVEGKSFEPLVLYHLGMIYQDIDRKKSRAFLNEAALAKFELGPDLSRHLSIMIAQL